MGRRKTVGVLSGVLAVVVGGGVARGGNGCGAATVAASDGVATANVTSASVGVAERAELLAKARSTTATGEANASSLVVEATTIVASVGDAGVKTTITIATPE